jgi:hypothetical protein
VNPSKMNEFAFKIIHNLRQIKKNILKKGYIAAHGPN